MRELTNESINQLTSGQTKGMDLKKNEPEKKKTEKKEKKKNRQRKE